jgi:uncharacterized protein (DUF1778 family)
MATKKRRKSADVRKDAHVNLRITQAQKDELTAAATHAGLSVSSWLVSLGLREARKADGGGKG